MLAFRYTHPRTGADVEIRQAARVPRDLPFDLMIGACERLVCWGHHAERDAAASSLSKTVSSGGKPAT